MEENKQEKLQYIQNICFENIRLEANRLHITQGKIVGIYYAENNYILVYYGE